MKCFKKVITFLAILIMVFSLISAPQAEAQPYKYKAEADVLHALGLYDGISPYSFNPDLGSPVDRETGITLIVKMFGRKEDAMALSDVEARSALLKYTDRNDISGWAVKYIAYAVKTNMVTGDTDTTISPKKPMDGKSFATLILRNLGYTVDGAGWRIALFTLADIGGMPASEAVEFNKPSLVKDDFVGIAYGALTARNINSTALIELLVSDNVVQKQEAVKAGLMNSDGTVRTGRGAAGGASEEETVRSIIRQALLDAKEEVMVPRYRISDTADELYEIITSEIERNPLVMYYDGGSYRSDGLLKIKYKKDAKDVLSHIRAARTKAYSVLSSIIQPGMTDYEKEIAVHDYIINNCVYDYENLVKGTLPEEAYTPYGVLVQGKGVCSGYAAAMKLMMDTLGIECRIVSGKGDGENHAWNIIKIGGSYYHLDVTWDDPVLQDGSSTLSYSYFNITDREAAVRHSWDMRETPGCTATEYNYYVYNNLIVNSGNELYEKIRNALKNNDTSALTYKVRGYSVDNTSVGKIISQALNNTQTRIMRCSYSVDEDMGVVRIFFE